MRVLLLGGGGLLGRALRDGAPAPLELRAPPRRDLDITDAAALTAAVAELRPDWVVNCAAYTAVDQAEAEPDLAYRVNAAAPMHLAAAVRSSGGRLLHLSTDYVFDGARENPYTEDDPPRPLSVYGWSKLAGEQAVRDILPDRHLLVRSQWLFGAGGRNFVDTILRLGAEGKPLRVVNDQVGRPTYAPDLARGIWALVQRDVRGTVHVANDGSTTWFDVAALALAAAGIRPDLEPCRTADMPRPARRPRFSVLDCSRFAALTGTRLPRWEAAVREHVRARPAMQGAPAVRPT